MTIAEALIFTRFLHYVPLLALFGIALFPLYAFSAKAALPEAFGRSFLVSLAGVSLLSGLGWFYFTAAAMTDSMTPDAETLWSAASETSFGEVWSVHLILIALLLVALLLQKAVSRRTYLLLAALALASLAGAGHTENQEGAGFVIHAAADGAHLLAAGAWLGGLLTLFALLRPSFEKLARTNHELIGVLKRFSGMGYAAVAILIASGLINSFYLVGTASAAFAAPYGRLLLLKLAAFAAMVLLAAVNRFWLMPILVRNALERGAPRYFRQLRLHVVGEQILGVLIVWLVSVLGTMEPAINSLAAVPLQ
jgi:putative copper resistance protein D